jgi:AcrR family transcriptional regulator
MHVSKTSGRATPRKRPPLTQAERRERTRNALLESAARGLSRYGYGNLVLERVAADAGYTRGAVYHLFQDKEDLALAVVAWVNETWMEEVGRGLDDESDPVAALLALARGHAIYCRRDVARLRMMLAAEFAGQDHPVGRAVEKAVDSFVERCSRLIAAARKAGSLPPGAPPRTLARAYVGAVEGLVIQVAGQAPYDEVLVERAARGLLGVQDA